MFYDNLLLRHELKYYINYQTYETLRAIFKKVLQADEHMMREEGYLISSIYFDDIYASAINEKQKGSRFRKKYRIRIYEHNPEILNLECKIKRDEYIAKQTASINREEYNALLENDQNALIGREEQICREIYSLQRTKRLHPVLTVEYMREAYVSIAGNVRITFDKDVSVSTTSLDLFATDFCTSMVFPKDCYVLEVKYDDFLPVHIQNILKSVKTEHCAISKYVMCREKKREVLYR